MIARILTVCLAVALPTAADASRIYVPSGPFTLQDGWRPQCMMEPARADDELPCVPRASSGADAVVRTLDRAEGYVLHYQLERAAEEIKGALTRTPDAALWHFSGRLNLEAGNLEAARDDLGRALALKADDGDALATAAYLDAQTGDLRPALQRYERALSLAPGNEHALVHSVYLSEQLRDADAYAVAISRLNERLPDHPVTVGRVIDSALARGDYRGALARAEATATRRPPTMMDRLRNVRLLQGVGEHKRAVVELDHLLGSEGASPRFILDKAQGAKLRFSRAISLRELKRLEEARRDVAEALKGAETTFLLRMSVFLVKQGFTDLAVTDVVTKELEASATACILNVACGSGMTSKI